MRPGHIRVFDGLRITTEHMEHLQGSLHSALQDIREIMGLGKVHSGFEVAPEGEQAITVQPGLAFDFQKNRIASDEPKTLEVTFAPEEKTKYVCLQYDQVEDGQVEGQFTLIWDSCAVVLRSDLPEAGENLIPIAKLTKAAEGEKGFEITGLVHIPRGKEGEEPPAAIEGPEGEELTEEAGNGEVAEEEAEEEAAPPPEAEGGMGTEEAETPAKENGEEELAEAEGSRSEPKPWRLRVGQGVVRLAADPGGSNYLSTLLSEPLRRKLSAKDKANHGELFFLLAEADIPLDFSASSLTCRSMISGTLGVNEEAGPGGRPAAGEEPPPYTNLQFQATAEGEVTCADGEVRQFGLTKMQGNLRSGPEGLAARASDLTERGIAHLPFAALMREGENGALPAVFDMGQNLGLLLRMGKAGEAGFKITCHLVWKGGITEEIIQKIETQKPSFMWEIGVGWKGLGESRE